VFGVGDMGLKSAVLEVFFGPISPTQKPPKLLSGL